MIHRDLKPGNILVDSEGRVAGIAGTSWQAARARAGLRTARTQTEVARVVADFLDELLRAADPDLARGRELTARELLDHAARKIEGAFPGRPQVEAALRTTIGRSYQGLGHFGEAEPHLRAALALLRRNLGDEHERTLEACNHVTWVSTTSNVTRKPPSRAGPRSRPAGASWETTTRAPGRP